MTIYTDSDTVYLDLIPGGWDGKVIPANNDFANATVLSTTLPGSITGDTTKDSGWEPGEASLGVSVNEGQQYQDVIGDQGVWYKFTPTSDGFYKFSFTNILRNGNAGSSFAFLNCMMIHTTSLSDFDYFNETGQKKIVGTEGASSFGSPGQTDMYVELKGGETYYMKVWSTVNQSFPGGGLGGLNTFTVSYNLAWSLSSRTGPANDDLANAEVIGATLPDSISGTTFDAWREEGETLWRNQAQTVWYKFTPPADGAYIFDLPNGTPHAGAGSNAFAYVELYDGTGLTEAKDFTNDVLVADSFMDATDDNQLIAYLYAGVDYYLQFISDANFSSGGKNWRAIDYSFSVDVYPTPPGDSFGDPIVITGSAGSEAFVAAGALAEPGEPASAYWSTEETGSSIWFEWECPATGYYAFRAEATDDDTSSVEPVYYMTVWTGSVLTSLTRIVRSVAGTQNDQGRTRSPATTCGFHAISGTTYRIQVVNSNPNNTGTDNSLLSWSTLAAPVGETTDDAQPFSVSRINNFGHTDVSELPPDVVATLSAHPNWWFTTGQPAKVKWFRFDVPVNMTVQVGGHMFDGLLESGNGYWISDAGLIAYKGTDYASLTVAQQSGSTVAAGMMLSGFETVDDLGSTEGRFVSLPVAGDTFAEMSIDATAGETIWVAVFALYDADYAGSTEVDANEFEIDIKLGVPAPGNDNLEDVGFITNDYYVSRSEFGNYIAYPHAGQREGTTVGATAEVGEPDDVPGFAPTRSVWYVMESGYFSVPSWTVKFWVESAVDCVMSIYKASFPYNSFSVLTHIASDDDSGPGDQPEITETLIDGTYWIKIDSKTEGQFTFKWQQVPGTSPPANNDFADATLISSLPFVATGTTVDANAEPEEREAEALAVGPTDSVWYKYVAPADGILKVWATCDTFNNDAYIYIDCWRGTAIDNLVRTPEPPGGIGGGDFRGFFVWGDTYEDVIQANREFVVDVVSGQTYYFRVQTESGGSEDFTIHIDTAGVYLDLQASGPDEMHGTLVDSAEVYLDLQVSSVEIFRPSLTADADTVLLDLQVSALEVKAFQYVDAGTARLVMTPSVLTECYFHLEPSWTADGIRKWQYDSQRKWSADGTRRWTWTEGEGLPQIC